MIDVNYIASDTIQWVVQGNQSMSWRANVCLAGSLGAIGLGVGLILAINGLWIVLPFAGAEALLVTYCLYLTVRKLDRKEVITVNKDAIRLEWGHKKPDLSVRLPRQWSRLRYYCPVSPFEVGDLSLAAHGKRYTLGQSLGRAEKRTLYRELNIALAN